MKLYIYGIVLLFSLQGTTQNLINDQSFKDNCNCNHSLGGLKYYSNQWKSASGASPDIFNKATKAKNRDAGTPYNIMGWQRAKTGTSYIGIYTYLYGGYREYLHGSLIHPLTKGATYRLTIHISLADKSGLAIKSFGALFTDTIINASRDTKIDALCLKIHKVKHYKRYNFSNSTFYTDKENWVPLTLEFVADGTEKYITIGNFRNNLGTKTLKVEGDHTKNAAYYYVDDVSLVCISCATPTPEITTDSLPTLAEVKTKPLYNFNTEYTFKNVVFAFNSYELSNAAKAEIKNVYKVLAQNPETTIIINGHTDNVGKPNFNLTLSENRATAVANYLIELGINAKHITTNGFGDTQPIVPNTTDTNRAKNRRVVFKIVKK